MWPNWRRRSHKEGAQVTLSGNLGFVPLDEVLRLLTRSNQQGSVDVRGEEVSGRVYLGKHGIDLATTVDDRSLHRLLVKAGVADDETLRRVAGGEITLASLVDEGSDGIIGLVREITVESLYQLGTSEGDFEVIQGDSTPFASPKAFDLEATVAEAERRAVEWQDLARLVPDLSATINFVRDLDGRDEVKISRDAWRVLSEIGRGASVSEIASELGTTEFWAARVTAQLLENGLVKMTASEPRAEVEPSAPLEPSASVEPVATRVDPDRSWWEEPEEEEPPAEQPEPGPFAEVRVEPAEEPHVEPEEAGVEPAGDAHLEPDEDTRVEPAEETPAASEDEDVEEDTEAFLEKVFSELGSSEEEREEGYGLLRRRRLGSMRDLSGD